METPWGRLWVPRLPSHILRVDSPPGVSLFLCLPVVSLPILQHGYSELSFPRTLSSGQDPVLPLLEVLGNGILTHPEVTWRPPGSLPCHPPAPQPFWSSSDREPDRNAPVTGNSSLKNLLLLVVAIFVCVGVCVTMDCPPGPCTC